MLCLFIIIKNGNYLQECFAAFLGRVKLYMEVLLRTWFVCIKGAVSPKSAAQHLLFWLLLDGQGVVYPKCVKSGGFENFSPEKNRQCFDTDGGGRVVRRCWVNFQCRGVLQL